MRKNIKALLILLATIFFVLAMFSYKGTDPGFFSDTSGSTAENLCGIFGAYVADLFYSVLGINSVLFSFTAILLILNLYRFGSTLYKNVFMLMFLNVWLLGAILSVNFPTVEISGETYSSGGILGSLMATFFVNYLNTIGAYLFLFGLLSFSIFWTFNKLSTSFDLGFLKFFKKERKILQISPEPKRIQVSVKQNVKEVKVIRKPVTCGSDYVLPESKILENNSFLRKKIKQEDLRMRALSLQKILSSYKIEGEIVDVLPGPIVTMFEFEPAYGVKVNSVANLSDDIAMKLRAESVRIIAPIPGKGAVGIEVPNDKREKVFYKEVFESDTTFFEKKLPLVLGKTTQGEGFTTDLTKMPHLLVAGATGAGKSVSLNAMICSILFTKTPDEVKLIMVDPKAVEFRPFEDIPHLLLPIINDPSRSNYALKWAVTEMERRYQLMRELNVRNLDSYNEKIRSLSKDELSEINKKYYLKSHPDEDILEFPSVIRKLPYIVIVIDELADLMLVAAKDVEISIARLAQKARAAGMHLIVATQRPSTDVITGLIKANFPSRISFRVASKIDSRIILDSRGDAETLLGNGDMLFLPPGASKICRVHGAYMSDRDVEAVVNYWKEQAAPDYLDEEEIDRIESPEEFEDDEKVDVLYDKAVSIVASTGHASTSMLQRKLDIGYNRAAKMIEMMEAKQVVGPPNGSKPREVYVSP